MSNIEQGKFYRVRYIDNNKEDFLESVTTLRVGRYYTLKNGRRFQVLKNAYFKYTYEDIDNLRVMLEDYDIGTVQYNLCIRMAQAFKQPIPKVSFSREERELLWYIYEENEFISEKHKETLMKVLNIKKRGK